jgi:ADP-heptose:LPS heptosyltransferase
MRSLVINLTRFGDLLQTQPVFTELKALGRETGLVCLDNFAGAAALLRDVDRVFLLPGAKLLANLDADWRIGLKSLHLWRHELFDAFPGPSVINLTPAVSARILSRHLASGPVAGFGLDGMGFREDSTPWGPFLEASAGNRGLSPFNLVDLFRKTAGLGQTPGVMRLAAPPAEELAEAERLLSAGTENTERTVAFQMGASNARRQWPVEYFAGLARLLREKCAAVPVLLGSKGEAGLGEEFLRLARIPAVNRIGETNLAQLAALLSRVDLLVSNDTGTMHLAAGLGTPVAAIFLATAQPFDTGPYLPGCLCLEPDMDCHPCSFGASCPHEYACRRAILPETVFQALEAFFRQGAFPAGSYPGTRAWETVPDEDGFMGLRSLSGHERQDRSKWIAFQRGYYRQFLDEKPFSPGAFAQADLSEQARTAVRTVLSDSKGLLNLLAQQGAVLLRLPREAMKAKFLATWRKLRDLWLQSPYFSILGNLWVHCSQEPGQDLGRFLGQAARFTSLIDAMSTAFEPGK